MPKQQKPTKTLKGDQRRRREIEYEEAYKVWRKIGPFLAILCVFLIVYSTYYITYKS